MHTVSYRIAVLTVGLTFISLLDCAYEQMSHDCFYCPVKKLLGDIWVYYLSACVVLSSVIRGQGKRDLGRYCSKKQARIFKRKKITRLGPYQIIFQLLSPFRLFGNPLFWMWWLPRCTIGAFQVILVKLNLLPEMFGRLCSPCLRLTTLMLYYLKNLPPFWGTVPVLTVYHCYRLEGKKHCWNQNKYFTCIDGWW